MQRERDYNEAAFQVLDIALVRATPVDFHVTEDLAIVPRLAGRESFDPDSDE